MQPAVIKAIYPGMITRFRYKKENTSDPRPICLVLYLDYAPRLFHALNLNFLNKEELKILFRRIEKGAGVYSDRGIGTARIEDQDAPNDYDDNLPYRNLLTEPYTRVNLPAYKFQREGEYLSRSEANRQMKMLYNRVIRKLIGRYDNYRTYSFDKMKEIRVLNFNLEF